MHSKSLALIIDCGSSSIKVGVVNSLFQCISCSDKPIQTKQEGPCVELDLDEIWNTTRKQIHETLCSLENNVKNVVGIGMTGQRSSFGFWTKEKSLGPALSWRDVRAQKETNERKPFTNTIETRTGLTLSPHYAAPKILWSLKNNSNVKTACDQGTLYCGTLSTYLVWKLTQGHSYLIDHTHAQRTLLFNFKKLQWDRCLCDLFQVPLQILPTICPTEHFFGCFDWQHIKIPILCCIGDAQAAFIGQQFGPKNRICIQSGSSAIIGLFTGNKIIRIPRILSSILYSTRAQISYYVEGTMNSAGSLFDFVKTNSNIALTPYESKETIIVPALNGLGAPHWDSTVNLTSIGKISSIPLENLVFQAIAYRCKEIISWMKKFILIRNRHIHLSGGLAQHLAFVKILADINEIPIYISAKENTSFLGVASIILKNNKETHSKSVVIKNSTQKSKLTLSQWQRRICFARLKSDKSILKNSLWIQALAHGRPLFFAHRGANYLAPENSMKAIEKAVENHADGIETDIRCTKDGIPILFHDTTLKRMTHRSGSIEKLTLKDVQQLSLCGKHQQDSGVVKIPVFEDLILNTPAHLLLCLEIKDEHSNIQIWKKVETFIKKHNAKNRVCVCSFNTAMATKFKNEYPDYCVGAIIGRHHKPLNQLESIYPELDVISLRSNLWNEYIVQLCRFQKQLLFAWTVNHTKEILHLWKLGVDGMITDHIEKFNTEDRDTS